MEHIAFRINRSNIFNRNGNLVLDPDVNVSEYIAPPLLDYQAMKIVLLITLVGFLLVFLRFARTRLETPTALVGAIFMTAMFAD